MENNADMKEEYDFSTMKSLGRGKYVERYNQGTNIIRLDSDVAAIFHDDKSVNEALRLLINIAKEKIPVK
jgi:hypothetical protein